MNFDEMTFDELSRPLGLRHIDDAYRHFMAMLGEIPDGLAIRSKDELRERIHQSGFRYEELDQTFFDDLFAGDKPWAFGPYHLLPSQLRAKILQLVDSLPEARRAALLEGGPDAIRAWVGTALHDTRFDDDIEVVATVIHAGICERHDQEMGQAT